MDNNLQIYKQLIFDNNEVSYDVREIKSIIEALLFTSGEPLSIEDISDALQINKKSVAALIKEMIDEFNYERRGIQIISFNNKYQICTRPEHSEYIRRLLKPHNKQSLSKAAIEVIAIIAYKQPVTRQAIDTIRGVKCDKIISNLVDKKLIKEVGRLETPGRPILYGTTDDFLRYFGLENLNNLPVLEGFKVNL